MIDCLEKLWYYFCIQGFYLLLPCISIINVDVFSVLNITNYCLAFSLILYNLYFWTLERPCFDTFNYIYHVAMIRNLIGLAFVFTFSLVTKVIKNNKYLKLLRTHWHICKCNQVCRAAYNNKNKKLRNSGINKTKSLYNNNKSLIIYLHYLHYLNWITLSILNKKTQKKIELPWISWLLHRYKLHLHLSMKVLNWGLEPRCQTPFIPVNNKCKQHDDNVTTDSS